MSAEQSERDGSSWPAWLESLRPDSLSRHRIRRTVMERARPLLERRRPTRAWEVAAGWADVLVPVAAVASVLFGVLAARAGGASDPAALTATASQTVRIEELLAAPGMTSPPAVLTRGNRPDLDGVLEAAIMYDSER